MSKLKTMQKKLGLRAGVAAGVLAGSVGVLMATGSMHSSAEQRKTNATNQLNQAQGQIASMRTQLEKSGEAEKRFIDLQIAHPNPDFSNDSEILKSWLRNAKDQYRFGNSFRLSLPAPLPTDKPELTSLNFDVTTRAPVRVELDAISDLHVFSFVNELASATPGYVRITRFEMHRKGEMDASSYRQMLAGLAPEFIGAAIEFTWIGLTEKPADPAAAPPPGAEPGAM